ncbi:MAG: tRNA/rRNA methyltransferase [Bacteroidales bacterium]|nr:tRNA/rRNA methyltransferase [Bacteroidales bacterium]
MKIKFILVEPKVPENIGASARAIKTMGFTSLGLVNPCKDPEGRALWLAHGSHDILENAATYLSLNEAIEGADLVIATTARKRGLQKDIVDVSDLNDFIARKKEGTKNIVLIFGREESGLSTEEMKLCDVATSISMAGTYPSLNLSQSVMIYAYELAKSSRKIKAEMNIQNKIPAESLRTLKAKVNIVLESSGIAKNENLYGRILERMGHLGDSDINLLHSISGSILDNMKGETNK